MFFIFSKILLFLLSPFWWLVFLLLWIWFTKNDKLKKRLQIITVIIALVFTNPFLYNRLTVAWQPERVNLQNKKFSVAIVLSGMGGYDANNNFNFGGSGDRFIQAQKLYHQGIVEKILVTGGSGKLITNGDPDEASGVKKELLKSGVPEQDILIETASRNTYENAVYSKKVLDTLHFKEPYVLVTSALHMPRSQRTFAKAGLTVVTFPCDYISYKRKLSFELFQPNPQMLLNWSFFLKEVVGYATYKITGKL